MKSDRIDFRTLPGQNELFLAYLQETEVVAPFLTPFSYSADDLDRRVEKVLEAQHLSRPVLVKVLRELNSGFNQGRSASRNIKKLESTDTLAVVTGQQVGVFGGPSYGVYKAATAVRLAAYLEERGYSAVPVFWLASDDSDFEEVRSVQLLDGTGSLASIRHPDVRESSRQMAGTVSVNSETLAEFLAKLSGSSARDEILQMIGGCFGAGSSFRGGFASWLANLFGRYGLVLFDPLAGGYREHLKDFVRIAVDRREELVASVRKRGDELKQAGFSIQVRVEESETFLFLIEPPSRYKLEFQNGCYQAKGRRSFRLSPSDFRKSIEQDEIALGTNVLLRPILQEFLFPNFGSVTGPAEIAYLSQVNALSPYWDQEIVAIPRAGFTIINRKAQRLLKKYDVRAEQILTLTELRLAEKILRKGRGAALLEDIDLLKTDLSNRTGFLIEKLAAEDPTVAQLLEGASRKINYQIDKVRRRFILNHETNEVYREGHLDYLRSHLVPRNGLQERYLNFNSFLVTEGQDLVDRLINSINPERSSHTILYL